MRRSRAMLAALAAIGLAHAVWGAPAPPKVNLQAEDMPLATALHTVAQQAGYQLVLPNPMPTARLTLRLDRMPADAALDLICRLGGVAYTLDGTTLTISRPEPTAARPSTVDPSGLIDDEALRLLRQAFEQRDEAAARRSLATWLHHQRPDLQQKLPEALAAIWRSWGETPAEWVRGALLFEQAGALDAARDLARLARREDQVEAEARLVLARVELERGDAGRAMDEARRALALRPDYAPAAATLALAAFYRGLGDEALAEAMVAQARWPRSPEVLAALGDLLRRDPQSAGQAAKLLQTALDLDEQNADALYGLAVLAAIEGVDAAAAWAEYLRAEPYTLRAARTRLGLAVIHTTQLTERGGPVWQVTADGQRLLYTMRFRKQLMVTDMQGFDLALQLTQQESDKVWASVDPDETELAWVAEARQQTLWLQPFHSSGSHRQIASGEPGNELRRTCWTPDGRYLLFSEHSRSGDQPKLRCWDRQTMAETSPPAPYGDIVGLADVTFLSPELLVGTLTRDGRESVVLVHPNGNLTTLRPPEPVGTYIAPTVEPSLRRAVYLHGRRRELEGAPADGSHGSGVSLLSSQAARGTATAVWAPDGRRLVVGLTDTFPTVLHLAGEQPLNSLLASLDPPTAKAARPTHYRFEMIGPPPTDSARLEAAVINQTGQATWSLPPTAIGPGEPVEVVPRAGVGLHWLRVILTVDGVVNEPRWYRFEVG